MARLMPMPSGYNLSHCHNLYHDHQNNNGDALRHSLMTFGVKFSASEVDDAFAEMKIDEGMIDAAHLKGLMVSK